MEKENLNKEITEEINDLEEQINTHSKLLSQFKDELNVQKEREGALWRQIYRQEQRIDTLTIRKRELEEKFRGENVFEK